MTNVCLTATVKDDLSNPVEGVLVNFNISGISLTTGFGYSDSLGNVQFCYTRTGSTPGTDHVYAEVSGITSNLVTVIWNIVPPCINPTGGGLIGNSQNGCGNYLASPLLNLVSPLGQTGNLEYKWQLSTTGNNSGFSDISGSNNGSYSPGILTQTSWFKRIARVDCKPDWAGAAESNVIEITVIPLTIVFNDDSLNISPTTCGGQNGTINGLKISGTLPLTITWTDKISGQVISQNADLFDLAVGLYEISVTDGNGCSLPAKSYVINDVGDIMIDTLTYAPSDCNSNNGNINVIAVSGLGSRIQYFVKSGNDTLSQWHNGVFDGLATGIYYIWAMDSSGCKSVYPLPINITNPPGPLITGTILIPATYQMADGKIMISATSTGDTLYYSLNGGTPQINNGNFNNLAAGQYTCTVTDEKGCDTMFVVQITEIYSVRLEAIAGDGSACLGNVAVMPLLANSFSHVSSFDSRLKYNKTLVTCQNYLNANPALADSLKVDLFPSLGELSLTWTGKNPVNLPDGSTLVELSFASLATGQDSLKWDISPGVSTFRDSIGNSINTQFTQGQVRVYSIPKGTIQAPTAVCEGSDIPFIGIYTPGSGNGTISYQWTGPNGFTDTNPVTFVSKATQLNAGEYTLSLADTNHCQSQTTIHVTVVPLPVADFTKDTIYFDEQTELQARQGYFSYTWNTGDSTSTILVTTEGWYKVTIQTAEGCTSIDSVMAIYSFVPLNMPNAFSPDGDGLNEVFRPVTLPENISTFSMYIYDRWGQQVFFSNNISKGWDGTIHGSPAQIGGYVYVVKYGNPSGVVREKRGMVTVVR